MTVSHSEPELGQSSTVERIVEHARKVVPDRPEFGPFLRAYFAHVDEADLESRHVGNLFGMAADHLRLAMGWEPDTIAIEAVNPRVDVDGWVSDHTVVRIVCEDMPFLVDSVTMELSRLGAAIHLVVHPVLARNTDGQPDEPLRWQHSVAGGEGDQLLSLISIEIDRQATAEDRQAVADNLRRVLNDVRNAVNDWQAMRQRMVDVSETLVPGSVPLGDEEIAETRELLEWLAADHFIFLGARDYSLDTIDGVEVLQIVSGSGLGVLEAESHLGRPRPLSELGPTARRRVHERRLLNLTKAGSRSTVHRASFLDYVGIKTFDPDGNVTGERRFLGLFTSEVYNQAIDRIPGVREKADEIVRRAGFPGGGHDEKRLKTILERYPRDDLIQMSADELFDVAISIAALQERRKVRIFARRELFGRFVTVLVYLPRDRYNTTIRTGIEEILSETYQGTVATWDAELSESVLARLRFVLQVTDTDDVVDTTELEQRIELLTQLWEDGLAEAVEHDFSDEVGLRNTRKYRHAFSPGYQQAFDPRTASADIAEMEQLRERGDMRLGVYREPGHEPGSFRLKLYRQGEPVSLSRVMPSLTNLGVIVVHERPYEIRPVDSDPVWIYDFSLEHHSTALDFTTASDLVEEAFQAVWHDVAEDDGLNQLVLGAGMSVSDVAVLRAYAHYLRQVGLNYSPTFVTQTLDAHPEAARLLIELFRSRFGPDGEGGLSADDRAAALADIEARLATVITAIESLDEDRVLRRFRNLILGTVRTTWAQRNESGNRRPYLAFKFDPRALDELPEPRPRHEIFVYSPRFEGVHLRGGDVARGGLRWSDRTEDFRTEVLGLVKAQMVKNSVIVPAGAKGGFVLKRRPGQFDDIRQEVVECYKLFISGLLDLTDNLVDGEVVPPADTVRYDGDDTYLVVAADKGTATFSDIANELAVSRGFWLGDAFASGGSNGYDHKAMGITARGAWESVKRHFRELGIDVQSEPFTAIGIGDMSGDVFGNGMLQSPFTRLIAAFDHRHIFIDPDPDPAASHEERQRLFDLPRSSWADYDTALLSPGGGVYERTAKSITLSPEAQLALGTDVDVFTPDELISTVLRAPVQLFWNGGIGTYIKASSESHAEVGDKANDNIRVNGRDLRCLVVGEGGNLGVTQRGRIEVAQTGTRIFTDAIDNAGGVDCSDHEVNIKILLDRVVANGDMTIKQRNQLLEEMTEEVASLVLDNNYRQALALTAARVDAPSLVDVHSRYISQLEHEDQLDRTIEYLPDAEEFAERRLADGGLTTPELAVLNAYSKNTLQAALLASSVPDEPALERLLIDYFPTALRERFSDQIVAHPLRREIIATMLANKVVNQAGVSMIYRLGLETSAPGVEIAAAHFAAWEIFALEQVVESVNALDATLPVERQLATYLSCRQLAERAARLLVRNRPNPFSATAAVAELADPVAETVAGLSEHLLGIDRQHFDEQMAEVLSAGMGEPLARRVAGLAPSIAALDIVDVAAMSGRPVDDVSTIHFAVADRLDLTWLRDRVLALPRDTQWATLARLTLRLDLYTDHRELTCAVAGVPAEQILPSERPVGEISDHTTSGDPLELLDEWMDRHRTAVERYRQTMVDIRAASPEIGVLLVAAREVRNLITRTSTTNP